MGLGAALNQDWDINIRLPVAYFLRTLIDTERQYYATKRERFAFIWAVNQFKFLLMEMLFVVMTNHHALKAMRTKANLAG